MTREEAKQGFEDMKKGLYPYYPNDYFDVAIKALEQKPVLDKIRAEIEELDYITFDGITKKRCLEIIDKYKAESEK